VTDSASDESDGISTSARLIVSLDVILFELTRMEEAVRDAPKEIADADRRTLRSEINVLWKRADALMT
jgi:hypothetical protein